MASGVVVFSVILLDFEVGFYFYFLSSVFHVFLASGVVVFSVLLIEFDVGFYLFSL